MPVIPGQTAGFGDEPCNWDMVPSDCCDDWDTFTPQQQERAIRLATTVLWAATGRRFGPCEVTVQPCRPKEGPPLYRVYPVTRVSGMGPFFPYLYGGQWFNPGQGGCGCCNSRCELPLQGPTSTEAVLEVTIDGVIQDPDSYTIMDTYRLVRLDGFGCWPTCVNYSKQDPPDFTVTYLRGNPVPMPLLDAAGVLACEFAKSCAGADCRINQNITSLTRQGVEFEVNEIDLSEAGNWQLTGVTEVDRIIRIYNPYGLTQRPRIISPDRPPARTVT